MSVEIIQIPFYETIISGMSGVGYAHAPGKPAKMEPPRTRPFIVGEENKTLSLLAYRVLQEERVPFPVLIHAPAGSGKTHFAEGLYFVWKSQNPHAGTEFLLAYDFNRRLNEAVRTQTMQEFQRAFYKLDFLVLDDIHSLADQIFAQQELIRVLDKLRSRRARVLITSSVPLSHLLLDPKLASRISEGLHVQLSLPQAGTRRAILELPENEGNGVFTEEARLTLAECSAKAEATVQEMLSASRHLEVRRRNEKHKKITSQDVLAHFEQAQSENAPAIEDIAKLTGRYYKIPLNELRGKSRRATLVIVRSVIYYLTRKMTNHTLAEIGEFFSGRDHATILHGFRSVESQLKTNPELCLAVESLTAELRPRSDLPAGKRRKK